MSPRRIAALALLLLPALAAPDLAAAAGGPLPVRSQFPLDLVTLDMTPQSARHADKGTTGLSLLFVRANTFEITPGYDARVALFDAAAFPPGWDFNVDSETTRASLGLQYQVGRRVSLGLEAPVIAHSGGFMDSMIENFHDAFGLPQNDRDTKEEDIVNIDLLGGTTRTRLTDDEVAMGDVVLRSRILLFDGRTASWTAVLEAKAPTGDEESFSGSGEWDYGLSFLVTAGSDRHVFHGGLGYQALGQPVTWPFEIDDRASGFAAYELSPNERWSIVFQLMGATSILPEQADYKQDGARAELAIGFHWTRGMFTLTSGFVENLLTNDNDSDLALFLGFGWEFGGR